MRQHLAGTGLVKRILNAVQIPKHKAAVVDLFAHDAWVPQACLQLQMESCSLVCASVAHTDLEYKFTKDRPMLLLISVMVLLHETLFVIVFVQEIILQNLFSKAKAKQITIGGFPDFSAAIADLSKVHSSQTASDFEYQVTVPAGPHLIVLQALLSKFASSSLAPEFERLLEAHDAEFNPEHKKSNPARGAQDSRTEASRSPKKLAKMYEDVESFCDKHKQWPA